MTTVKKIKICIEIGTRPEIIKMASLLNLLVKQRRCHFVIHTGQHYSYSMDKLIFKDLRLRSPKYNLEVGSGSHGYQTSAILQKTEEILVKEKPDLVLVQGDTNSGVAVALAAVKLGIRLGHIEAGLRSFDRKMPEEINRVVMDHIADFLFAPTQTAKKHLLTEGIDAKKIIVTGNTIVDAVLAYSSKANLRAGAIKKLDVAEKNYILVTIHRPENTDNKSNLSDIVKSLILLNRDTPVVWPVHPRTISKLKALRLFDRLQKNGVHLIEPVGFVDFLALQKNAKVILTDSGGVQEEAVILKTPCVTIRQSTERPESTEVGANVLSSTDPGEICRKTQLMANKNTDWKNPFGDGKSAKKILDYLDKAKF